MDKELKNKIIVFPRIGNPRACITDITLQLPTKFLNSLTTQIISKHIGLSVEKVTLLCTSSVSLTGSYPLCNKPNSLFCETMEEAGFGGSNLQVAGCRSLFHQYRKYPKHS